MRHGLVALAATLAVGTASLATAQTAKPKKATPKKAAVKASADPIQTMLDAGKLAAAYNPVLLTYLVEEGGPRLPEAQRKMAVDQLVTRFKSEIEIRPAEQGTAALATLGGLLAGGTVGEGLSEGAASVWSSWVDAAFVLQKAGYTGDTAPFFENCLKTFPYERLRARCAAGLATADAARAYAVLTDLLDKKHGIDVNNVALRLMGSLVGSGTLPDEQKTAALDAIIARTQGMMNTSHNEAAIAGLALARDPRAIEPLRKMTGGMRAEDVKRAALRTLVLVYDDAEGVAKAEKMVKGGFGKDDEDKFFAGALLIEADKERGFAYAQEQLAKKKGGFMGKLTKSKSDRDYSADIVRVLVDSGHAQAAPVLKAGLAAHEPGEWISTYMAIGLLHLGDRTGIELVEKALHRKDWTHTRLRAAEALAKVGSTSGVAVLADMASPRGFVEKVKDLASGRAMDPESLRSAVARSLGRIDHADAVPVLVTLLDDESDIVRLSAARALATMTDAAALDGMTRAIAVDYGKQEGRSRNPEVHAMLVRRAAAQFAADPRTTELLEKAAGSQTASVRFLALVALKKA